MPEFADVSDDTSIETKSQIDANRFAKNGSCFCCCHAYAGKNPQGNLKNHALTTKHQRAPFLRI
jgi:hypothetical protein